MPLGSRVAGGGDLFAAGPVSSGAVCDWSAGCAGVVCFAVEETAGSRCAGRWYLLYCAYCKSHHALEYGSGVGGASSSSLGSSGTGMSSGSRYSGPLFATSRSSWMALFMLSVDRCVLLLFQCLPTMLQSHCVTGTRYVA